MMTLYENKKTNRLFGNRPEGWLRFVDAGMAFDVAGIDRPRQRPLLIDDVGMLGFVVDAVGITKNKSPIPGRNIARGVRGREVCRRHPPPPTIAIRSHQQPAATTCNHRLTISQQCQRAIKDACNIMARIKYPTGN